MTSRLRQFVEALAGAFWLLPTILVVLGLLAGEGLVDVERAGWVSPWLLNGWLYSGGGSGARTLLGAVASSTIGVAGTIFSITIAALTLASSQMGPRLLDNFTRDRGVQAVLGLFLGSFAFALMVLRSVRGADESEFVPHLAVSVAIALAFGCVAALVFFVHHMAGRINVDTVIHLVHRDLQSAAERLTNAEPGRDGSLEPWPAAVRVSHPRQGYLQQLDDEGLADWAQQRGVRLRLSLKPGDFVFPGVPVLEVSKAVDGPVEALQHATAVGAKRVGSADLEFGVRQLVDVGVRALSPGINDPQTAVSVLDRLGAVLCGLAPRHLPNGVVARNGVVLLSRPVVTYDGLVDAMFDTLRQNAQASPAVLIRLMDVLTAVAQAETNAGRLSTLRRHAALVMVAGERGGIEPAAMSDLRDRRKSFDVASETPGTDRRP